MIAGSSKKSEKEKFAEQFEKAVKEEADKNKDKK